MLKAWASPQTLRCYIVLVTGSARIAIRQSRLLACSSRWKKIDGSNKKPALLICVHSLIVINCEMPQIPIIKSVNSFAVAGRHIPPCISSTSNSRTTRRFLCMCKKALNVLLGMTFQTVTCLYLKWTENGIKLECLAQICPSSRSTEAVPPKPGHLISVSFVCYTVLRHS